LSTSSMTLSLIVYLQTGSSLTPLNSKRALSIDEKALGLGPREEPPTCSANTRKLRQAAKEDELRQERNENGGPQTQTSPLPLPILPGRDRALVLPRDKKIPAQGRVSSQLLSISQRAKKDSNRSNVLSVLSTASLCNSKQKDIHPTVPPHRCTTPNVTEACRSTDKL